MWQVERAVSPTSGGRWWLLVDSQTFEPCSEVAEYVLFLSGRGASPETARAYVPRIGRFLNWCLEQGVDWRTISLGNLTRFKFGLEQTPTQQGRIRSGRTVNAFITAVTEFLKFCGSLDYVPTRTVEQLSEPRFLSHVPIGFDASRYGRSRLVTTRVLRAPETVSAPVTVSADVLAACLAAAHTARDRFLVVLLARGGVRIGEALGLRRSDMHFLPSSQHLGCHEEGAHVHVVHRSDNGNGARAKSKRPRSVPVTREVTEAYRDYLHERSAVPRAECCDFVFVNLSASNPGRPMSYPNAKQIIEHIGDRARARVRPHMLRHTAATDWTRAGTPIDVVQALLGHASAASTAVYQHPDPADLRSAVERVATTASRHE